MKLLAVNLSQAQQAAVLNTNFKTLRKVLIDPEETEYGEVVTKEYSETEPDQYDSLIYVSLPYDSSGEIIPNEDERRVKSLSLNGRIYADSGPSEEIPPIELKDYKDTPPLLYKSIKGINRFIIDEELKRFKSYGLPEETMEKQRSSVAVQELEAEVETRKKHISLSRRERNLLVEKLKLRLCGNKEATFSNQDLIWLKRIRFNFVPNVNELIELAKASKSYIAFHLGLNESIRKKLNDKTTVYNDGLTLADWVKQNPNNNFAKGLVYQGQDK